MSELLWQPSASIANLRKRAEILASIRQFFKEKNYLEVETPILAKFGVTDVYLSNIKANFRGQAYALQTSPEYHMKRLLAAGSGSIFQLARVFREDELGRWHNPEFTMLEWYRLDFTMYDLIAEVDALLQRILGTKPVLKLTYREIFYRHCDKLDPFTASIEEFKGILNRHHLGTVLAETETDRDQYLFLLMSHIIEPALAVYPNPVAVYNYPASQAVLATVKEGEAARFEFYFKGIELANGFHELLDPLAQKARFEEDLAQRRLQQLETPAIDIYLLEALEHGLPPCSGVALGIDRLLALSMEQKDIAATMSFDFSRA